MSFEQFILTVNSSSIFFKKMLAFFLFAFFFFVKENKAFHSSGQT